MERCAHYRHGEGWENGSKFNLCLGSEEEMENQMKGAIKRIGLRKELKKSQRGRLRKEKQDKVGDLRWALSWIRGTDEETSYLPCHRCWAGLEGNLAFRPFDLGPVFWTLKAAGGFYSPYHLHCYHGFSTAINVTSSVVRQPSSCKWWRKKKNLSYLFLQKLMNALEGQVLLSLWTLHCGHWWK